MSRTVHNAKTVRHTLQYPPTLSVLREMRTRLIAQGRRVCGGQFRGLVSAGFASPRKFLTSRLISRQVTSSVYEGEKVSAFTQPMRSAAGNVDQFVFNCSRVRCSVARQDFILSSGVASDPPIEPA